MTLEERVTALAQQIATTIKTTLVARSLFTAKGTVLAGSAASTPTTVAAGALGQVLTADPTATAGVKWASTDAGGPHPFLLMGA